MSRIVAVVVTDSQQISGGVPVFHAKNREEQQHLILNLEKILDANAHDLKNGTYILVDHTQSS